MKKAIAFSIMVFAVLVIMGCNTSITEDTNGDQNISVNDDLNIPNEGVLNNVSIDSAGACTPQWRCISSQLKAYQLANCSFVSKLRCPLGCFNDSCRIAETCTPGFGCVNDHIKGYQMESCQWASQTNCDWKGENGDCVLSRRIIQNQLPYQRKLLPQPFRYVPSSWATLILLL